MPGNAVLPAHKGMLITRNLQEWACMFPLDLPFATVERLLGWQTQCDEMICATEVRRLVRRHGEVIRQAEAAEVEKLLKCENLSGLKAQLVPSREARRPAAWPEELTEAVKVALEADTDRPAGGTHRYCATAPFGAGDQARPDRGDDGRRRSPTP